MSITRYRKKPVVIEAIQFTGGNSVQVARFITAHGGTVRADTHPTDSTQDVFFLTTVHGDVAPARSEDWIIPDGQPGTFYPCKPDIFDATYEPVTEPEAGR